MPYHNIHAHIFTMNNAPEKFLSLYMPEFAANTIDKVTGSKAGARATEWLLNRFGGSAGKKYASFLHVGKRSGQMDVFTDLLAQYPDSSMKITALTVFMEELGASNSISGYEGQIEEIINVKRRYPERLLIFFGIDPRWKATGDELLQTVKTYFESKLHINSTRPDIYPFCGLKLYPSTGFYAFDEKLLPTFEWAATNNVPIMTHCSYLGGIYNNDRDYLSATLNSWNPYAKKFHPAPKPDHVLESKIFKRLINIQKLKNNQNYSSYFLEPDSYRDILQHFKNKGTPLRICFAHFGGSDHMKLQHSIQSGTQVKAGNYFGLNSTMNWTAQIQHLMSEFDSVYTDISYSLTDHDTHDFIFSELKQPYGNRILFGTDFFMTERVAKEKDTFASFRKKALETNLNNRLYGPITAWELLSRNNVESFLENRFYNS